MAKPRFAFYVENTCEVAGEIQTRGQNQEFLKRILPQKLKTKDAWGSLRRQGHGKTKSVFVCRPRKYLPRITNSVCIREECDTGQAVWI